MNINEKLIELYNSNLSGLQAIHDKFDDQVDGPQMMYCWEENYKNAEIKILFIGQEPNTWIYESWAEIERPLERYKEFALATNKKNDETTFWKGVVQVNEILNRKPDNRLCFLWTNVSKYSTKEGGRVADKDFDFINENFNVLQSEINIIKPDVVIFFSGPDLDERITTQFEGKLIFEKIHDQIPSRQLAKIIHKNLPRDTYRVYHPSALQRQKKWNYLQLIINQIKDYNTLQILELFKTQMHEVAKELDLIIDENSEFSGLINTGFYFYKQNWKYCSIGFEFEKGWASDFFYGICRKDMDTSIPENIVKQISSRNGDKDGETEFWPLWKWLQSEDRNWTYNTLDEIRKGETKQKIKNIVKEMMITFKDIDF